MGWLRAIVGSLLAWSGAAAAFVAANWSGGELAARLGLPPGGDARLAWDLTWTVAAGALALWIVARWTPAARAQAMFAWVLLAALTVWAVATLGSEYPSWFDAALLLALPLLGVLAWRWADASRRTQKRRA
ncbi:hypothetical protein [Lysobacter enzymogenes]|uniref:hypothetical protein n=1 Tax=Lysobacter enzymogenes TaxID=69 RepID=UPI001A971801|nr:hypothetical protein [Lysobacter enzymogenes]QQP94937.1 hypothetical protein JHW38_17005 [Lysobacter enzymogenes]